jgi:hypothetical protein
MVLVVPGAGVFLLYTLDDSEWQMLETWLWDRLSSWSDVFALSVSYQKLASVDYVGVSSLYHM